MLLKNHPNSRKICTFDTKRRFVELLTMIGEDSMLAKIKQTKDSSYWSLMNTQGQIMTIPTELERMLNLRTDWN